MSDLHADLVRRLEDLARPVREALVGIRRAVKIAPNDPDMALTRTRKVLEYVARQAFERHNKEPAGTRDLMELLQHLVKAGHMPRLAFTYANAVRELGNVGAHAFGEGVSACDAYHSLGLLVPVLEWYRSTNGGRRRRRARSAATRCTSTRS
jgi:hypothetical protein